MDLTDISMLTSTLGTSSSDLLDPFGWVLCRAEMDLGERPTIRAGYFRSVSFFVQRDLWALQDASSFGASPDQPQILSRVEMVTAFF